MVEPAQIADIVQDMVSVGVFVVDRRMNIILWNRFMEIHSQLKAEDVLGRNLVECFPELNAGWIDRKLKSVLVLKNQSFTSWRQRPYLLRFPSVPSLKSSAEHMFQDCAFWPARTRDGQVVGVCISVHDVTETAVTQRLLEQATEEALNMEESSQRDALTGLYNRGYLDDQIQQEVLRSRRYQWSLGLMMIDIDHFKKINDVHGHQAGDEVLRVVAFKMLQRLRASDTLCRYGGEEFALILPQAAASGALKVAEDLRQVIGGNPIPFAGKEIAITCSIGVAMLRDDMSAHELIGAADQCLYASKQNGRNRVTLSTD